MSAIKSPIFATLLTDGATATIGPADARNVRLLRHRLLIPVALVAALLLTWAAFAPLAGAVVAPAQIRVDLNRKTVQHRQGGIVRQLLVRDGQEVRAGEPLVVIGVGASLQPTLDHEDQQIVRSPVDGEIMEMRVSSAGQIVAPWEPLLDVVPAQARLVVEARIQPEDIKRVQEKADVQVRLTSFDARTTPLLSGNVTFVSSDRTTSADGRETYFTATVEVDATKLKGHPEVRLRPGMPAELYVATGTRSLFRDLLRPVTRFALRAMRES
jgi:multidrug efflux pump subunit AcrA (membrane-fusion protein)